jgi:hypothetical protein
MGKLAKERGTVSKRQHQVYPEEKGKTRVNLDAGGEKESGGYGHTEANCEGEAIRPGRSKREGVTRIRPKVSPGSGFLPWWSGRRWRTSSVPAPIPLSCLSRLMSDYRARHVPRSGIEFRLLRTWLQDHIPQMVMIKHIDDSSLSFPWTALQLLQQGTVPGNNDCRSFRLRPGRRAHPSHWSR